MDHWSKGYAYDNIISNEKGDYYYEDSSNKN